MRVNRKGLYLRRLLSRTHRRPNLTSCSSRKQEVGHSGNRGIEVWSSSIRQIESTLQPLERPSSRNSTPLNLSDQHYDCWQAKQFGHVAAPSAAKSTCDYRESKKNSQAHPFLDSDQPAVPSASVSAYMPKIPQDLVQAAGVESNEVFSRPILGGGLTSQRVCAPQASRLKQFNTRQLEYSAQETQPARPPAKMTGVAPWLTCGGTKLISSPSGGIYGLPGPATHAISKSPMRQPLSDYIKAPIPNTNHFTFQNPHHKMLNTPRLAAEMPSKRQKTSSMAMRMQLASRNIMPPPPTTRLRPGGASNTPRQGLQRPWMARAGESPFKRNYSSLFLG
jgi:hypothetical protein